MDLEKIQTSKNSSVTTLSVAKEANEKGTSVQVDILPVPDKDGSKTSRFLRHNFFSTYRRIFSLVFSANLAVFIALLARSKGSPNVVDVGIAGAANLAASVLFRQEDCVNILYEFMTLVPLSAPYYIRKQVAEIYHHGGAHSSTGVTAMLWHILYTAVATRDFVKNPTSDAIATVVTSYVILALFLFILIMAHPTLRAKYHDTFEAVHRFSGWSILGVYWVHIIISAVWGGRVEGIPTGLYLARSASFWFLCIATAAIILSWARLRKREVFPEYLSDHVIRLHFKYKKMKPFHTIKMSTNPLMEWHSFATIPDGDENGNTTGFSVVISHAGDWTRNTIRDPPKKIWIRGAPVHEVLFSTKMFKRVVVVATGSGIGPCLSMFYADKTPRRIIWFTSNPEPTYGKTIIDTIYKADKNAIVWNTREQGKPDMVALVYRLVKEFDAEAVYIVSNPSVTKKVVYGMQTRGVPAYGPIFDS